MICIIRLGCRAWNKRGKLIRDGWMILSSNILFIDTFLYWPWINIFTRISPFMPIMLLTKNLLRNTNLPLRIWLLLTTCAKRLYIIIIRRTNKKKLNDSKNIAVKNDYQGWSIIKKQWGLFLLKKLLDNCWDKNSFEKLRDSYYEVCVYVTLCVHVYVEK